MTEGLLEAMAETMAELAAINPDLACDDTYALAVVIENLDHATRLLAEVRRLRAEVARLESDLEDERAQVSDLMERDC